MRSKKVGEVDDVELTRVPVVEEWRMVGSRMPWKEQHIQGRNDDATESGFRRKSLCGGPRWTSGVAANHL